jgi:ribosome-associated toxin RatA of RatAB toxin-antitoxin module
MAQAEVREVLPVAKDKLWATIIKYEDYPQFVDGCKSVKVNRTGPNQARVTYNVSLMSKDIAYTLDHVEDRANHRMTWKLVEGTGMKVNNGTWELKDAGTGKTDVRYSVEVEFSFYVPGLILKGLVKSNLPSMVKSFASHAAGSRSEKA